MGDPFSVAGSAVGVISLGLVVAQGLYDYYSAIRDGKSDIAQTSRKMSLLLKTLQSMRPSFEQQGQLSANGRPPALVGVYIDDCREAITELEEELAKFQSISLSRGVRDGMRAAGRRVAYPLRQSTLRKLEENVDDIISSMNLAVQGQLKKDVDILGDRIHDMNALLELTRAAQVDATIKAWLNAPDATSNLNAATKMHHSRTGMWFVRGDEFIDWLAKPGSFIWLVGFAGCGKSVLSSVAIRHTFRHRRSDPRIGIAFFYFTANEDSKRDASAMLRALILQLSSQLDAECKHVSALYDAHRPGTPPVQALVMCLSRLMHEFKDVYLFLDGLDECPVEDNCRKTLLSTLADLRSQAEPGLHILASSRDEPDIRRTLGLLPMDVIRMQNRAHDEDIASFITHRLETDPDLCDWYEYHDMIKDQLTTRANGVFLWVDCQFRALEGCPQNQRVLERVMESLPPTLDKTYEKILVNIPPTCKDFAQKMLILLCYARRPLSLGELTDGIAVELGDTPTFNSKDKFRNIISLQKLCPGIVDVDTEADGENPTLRLAHSSVREYLESESIMASTKTAPFSINRVLANTQMACICLAIVLQENDAPTPSPREISAPFPKLTGPSTTLMPYASRYWNAHFRRGDDQSPARHQILRLFSQPDMFRRWVATWNHVDYDGILSGEPPSPLYYAVCLGLREFIPGILSRASLDVNAVGGTDGNALQAAAARGDERAVRILVDHGADVNIRCGVFGGALQAASHCGHEGIVRYLLDRGSDVNAREDGTHMSALYEASAEGHESIVELLISNGAHVNTLDEYGGTALHIASNRGHAHVVPILICHDALLDQEGGRYGTAVEAASRSGHHEMVQLLIDHGAKNFQCALQEAASRGYEQTVQVLLANKADVNACPKGPSSLELASANGHEGTVQLLIDSGAETDRWSLIKETPLERASAAGHGAIVRRLLDHGASVGDGFLGTALHSASLHGHDEIVQMLIDHGADVNAFSEQRGIPLLAAALNGHEGTVRILLHHKACLCDSHYYDDALRTISQRGYGSILPLLDAYGPSLLDDPANNDVSRLLAQGGPDDLNIVTRNAVLQLFSALNARAPPDNDWLIDDSDDYYA